MSVDPDAVFVVAGGSGAALPHEGMVERGFANKPVHPTHGAARFDLIGAHSPGVRLTIATRRMEGRALEVTPHSNAALLLRAALMP